MSTGMLNPEASQKLAPLIYFGGSSWNYDGWKGLIYQKQYKSEKDFKANSLEEYASLGMFRTVGIDRFFYNPPSPSLLEEYAAQVPDDFLWVSKVWERITIPQYPNLPRYGKFAGKVNDDFLNAELFTEQVLAPYKHAKSALEHTGPFVFQFPSIAKGVILPEEFMKRLDSFLGALPKEFRYATEVRNRNFISNEYFKILNAHGATHCFNHWSYMPKLIDQMKAAADAGGLSAPFYVARILTPRGIKYADAVKKFQPYDKLLEPNEEMRRDVVRLIKRALERQVPAFVIVNNRMEGNSPMTIQAISELAVSNL